MHRSTFTVTALGLVALATVGSVFAGSRPTPTIEAHLLVNKAREQLAVWRAPDGVWISRVGTTDVLTVRGNILIFRTNGKAYEQIRYVGGVGPWHVIGQRFLVTRRQVAQSLVSTATTRVPAGVSADDPGTPITFTTVTDFGTNTGALARATPFSITDPGTFLLGHALVDAYQMTLRNSLRHTDSGPVATLVYSLYPTLFGNTGDDEIEINVADGSGSWGKAYAQLMVRHTPNDDGTIPVDIAPGIVRLNAHQIVMRAKGNGPYISITTTSPLADPAWSTIVQALKKAGA